MNEPPASNPRGNRVLRLLRISRRPTGSKTFGADKAHLSKPGMLYRRKRDFEAASAFALFKRSVAVRRRCVNSRISSSGLLRIFQKRHCS